MLVLCCVGVALVSVLHWGCIGVSVALRVRQCWCCVACIVLCCVRVVQDCVALCCVEIVLALVLDCIVLALCCIGVALASALHWGCVGVSVALVLHLCFICIGVVFALVLGRVG